VLLLSALFVLTLPSYSQQAATSAALESERGSAFQMVVDQYTQMALSSTAGMPCLMLGEGVFTGEAHSFDDWSELLARLVEMLQPDAAPGSVEEWRQLE
jgi:hypothetical protein